MMNSNRRKHNRRLDNKGSTMVETLVSFVVLSIVLLALFKMVSFSSQLRMRAVDTATVRGEFNQEMYKNLGVALPDKTSKITGHGLQDVEVKYYVGAADTDASLKKKASFVLILDEKDASKDETVGTEIDKNFGTGVSVDSEKMTKIKKQVTMPYINAISYTSTDSRLEEEQLVVPKALRFMYHR